MPTAATRLIAKLFLVTGLFTAGSLRADVRTFTSPDGRTLEAEIVGATPDQVSLKLATGQTIVTQISRFSTADQQMIHEWRKQNPVAIKYDFAANFSKEKTGSSENTRGTVNVKTDSWVCKMKIINRSGQTLEGVDLDYTIFYNEVERGQPVLRKQLGKATIASIKHLEEQTVPTAEIKLSTTTLDGNYYYADGSRARKKDSLEGLAIVFKHAGKPVYQWASSGVPKDRVPVAKGAGTGGSVFDR